MSNMVYNFFCFQVTQWTWWIKFQFIECMGYKEMNGSFNFWAEKMITKNAVKHFSKLFLTQLVN
jgi:hypothetical protein